MKSVSKKLPRVHDIDALLFDTPTCGGGGFGGGSICCGGEVQQVEEEEEEDPAL